MSVAGRFVGLVLGTKSTLMAAGLEYGVIVPTEWC